MNKNTSTKKALLTSVLCLLLCCSMLVGTTFAWFTDEVKSGVNHIYAGNLDVEVIADNGKSISDPETVLFDGILWEPGVVAYENITVQNLGSLALKYAMSINFENENYVVDANGNKTPYGLSTALKVAVIEGGIAGEYTQDRTALVNSVTDWVYLRDLGKEGVLYPNDNIPTDVEGAASEKTYGIVIYWQPSDVDNNWNVCNGKTTTDTQPLHIDLGINLTATQYTYEKDSFDEMYDENAFLGTAGYGVGPVAEDILVYNDSGAKIGSVLVQDDSVDNLDDIEVTFALSDYQGNFTVEAGMSTLVYDIAVTNLIDNNDAVVKVEIRLPAGLDPKTVKLYHYDEEIVCTYNPESGYVKFETKTFSPFTVVYDADSEYVAPELPEDLPIATVVRSSEYENTDLEWGRYGAWSPTEGLDSKLEAAYTFSCSETLEEAKQNPYANWYCDFVVVLNEDLGANEIFLGGNYGSFGWVGFHNGDLTLEENTEIPLLGSVTSNPWTYLDVVQSVGTFICGVGDVNDALTGATFTVMLRLTNPENPEEFYNVATINYTFK